MDKHYKQIPVLCIMASCLFLFGEAHAQGLYNNGGTIVLSPTSKIYIDGTGNYRNEGSGTIINTGTGAVITLPGNWTNNGSTAVFSNDGATVLLSGSTQNIGGTNATTFYNLTAAGAGMKTMLASITVSNVLTLTGQDIAINGNTLTLGGTISGTGKPRGSATSNLTINGTGAFGTLNLNNSSLSNKTLNNLTVNRTSTGSVTLGTTDSIYLRGTLTISNGTLNTSGKLLLVSDAGGTARVDKITCGSCGVSGNVIVQRYIPGGPNKRRWRFLSSPINVSGSTAYAQLIDNIHVTGGAGSIGFDDPSPNPNNPSARTYTESVPGTSDQGWTAPGNINATIPTGIGFEVFVRGSRALANPFILTTIPDNATIDYIGTLNSGTISPAITYTNTGFAAADGFNLVGNPYACQIDWKASSGWVKTNIQDRIWCYNPNTGTYGIFDGALNSGTNGITSIIASGQGFFIKASSASPSPVISFGENVKVATAPFNYYRTNTTDDSNDLRLQLVKNNSQSDEWIFHIDEGAGKEGTDPEDAPKLFNHGLNLYSVTDDSQALTIDTRPQPRPDESIRLNIATDHDDPDQDIADIGFELIAKYIPSFDNDLKVYLEDLYLNKLILLNSGLRYPFQINTDERSTGAGRFRLVFSNRSIQFSSEISQYILFPNPVEGILNIRQLSALHEHRIKEVIIYNSIGQKVYQQSYNDQQIMISGLDLQPGLYHTLIISEAGKEQLSFLKKN